MPHTLVELQDDFAASPLLAMPVAGVVVWTLSGVAGFLLPEKRAALAMFVFMPCVFPLAIFISLFSGENLLGRGSPRNPLDTLFGYEVLMANLCWAIAIPFWMVMPSSLPLSCAVLTALMWVPLSWLIRHPVGLWHALGRITVVVPAWFLFPQQRFVLIPAIVVLGYLAAIVVLARRHADLIAGSNPATAAQ